MFIMHIPIALIVFEFVQLLGVEANTVAHPKTTTNIIAAPNSNKTLQCPKYQSSSSSTRWTYHVDGHSEPKVIHTGDAFDARLSSQYSVKVSNGHSELTIFNVDQSVAGQYSCSVHPHDARNNVHFNITVKDAAPVSESTTFTTTTAAVDTRRSVPMYAVAGVCLLTTAAFAIATICYVRKYTAGSRRASYAQSSAAKTQEAQSPIMTSAPDEGDSQVIYDDALNVLRDSNVSRNIVNGCFLYAEVVKPSELKTDGERAGVAEFTIVECTSGCDFEPDEVRTTAHDEGFFPSGRHRDTPPTYDDVGAILSTLC